MSLPASRDGSATIRRMPHEAERPSRPSTKADRRRGRAGYAGSRGRNSHRSVSRLSSTDGSKRTHAGQSQTKRPELVRLPPDWGRLHDERVKDFAGRFRADGSGRRVGEATDKEIVFSLITRAYGPAGGPWLCCRVSNLDTSPAASILARTVPTVVGLAFTGYDLLTLNGYTAAHLRDARAARRPCSAAQGSCA
jgi:hypothetical protein